MTKQNRLHGLVLAGGESRRMGTDKALLRHGTQTQLSYAVELLQRSLNKVFVSARSGQAGDPERSQYPLVVDRYSDMGPIAGILSAMEEYPDTDWLVIACDLPNITDRTIATLLDARSSTDPFVAYKSSRDGLPEPLCAIYAANSRKIIDKFVSQQIVCPRKMLIRSATHLLEPNDPSALDNMNTPDDLKGSDLELAS